MRPPGAYRLPPPGRDGILRRTPGGGLARLVHHGDEAAAVRAWPTASGVRLRAEAPSRATAAYAVERMRFGLGLDHDLAPFHRSFVRDRLLGPIIRRRPWLRPIRRAEPFEALAWGITEQLIETERAWAIQRRLTWRYGRRSECGSLRDAPSPAALARRAQPELQACDLSAGRARALVRASREVASGRVDLRDPERSWLRLERIPGIGPWTLEKLGFHGQGRDDRLPAGDLAYLKLVGRLEGLGRRATVDEVREWFAPYQPFAAMAGLYLLVGGRGLVGATPPATVRGGMPVTRPVRGGARW